MSDCGSQIKQSQIPEQVSYLAEASDELHKAIEVLENRLIGNCRDSRLAGAILSPHMAVIRSAMPIYGDEYRFTTATPREPENRLSDVLHSPSPSTPSVDEKPSSLVNLVNLAARLRERVASIKVATTRITDILSRLEV